MKYKDYFTVVVADDETELREAVCQMIPWEELGFRLVGSAGNGLDALQYVEQLRPDFLLTDIRMPFISGVSLARQVRELQPLIQIAFLSGYDDFEYAKKAIDYDVISYMLKPISMAELTDSLREIHKKIEAKFDYFRAPGGAGEELRSLLQALLLDSFAEERNEAELTKELAAAGLKVSEPYKLLVLSVGLNQEGENCTTRDMVSSVDKVLGAHYRCNSFFSGGRILCLLVSEEGFGKLSLALDELISVAKRVLGLDCTVGMSREFTGFARCNAACREAVDAQRLSSDGGISRISETREGVSLLCDRATDIIEHSYMDEEISLGSVSEQLHVSPNYLSANMKKYAGDTFINLLIKKRMEVASSLLTSGNLKIFEVAKRCGYSDQHYFSFCFKKYYGLSPAQLRRGEPERGAQA